MAIVKGVRVPAPAIIQRQPAANAAPRAVQVPAAFTPYGERPGLVIQRATVKKSKWNGTPGLSATEKKALKNKEKLEKHVAKVEENKKQEMEKCKQSVNFTATFNAHVLHGEAAGTSHSGYHSENVTNHALFGNCNVTHAADGYGVVKASCIMANQTNAKGSSFFPAGWDIARIRQEAKHAYCNPVAKGGIAGAGPLAWVGASTVAGLLIGGTSGLPLNTAFPSHNGNF